METSYQEIIEKFKNNGNSSKALILSRFFKTGKGEYAEGDKFLGITVPVTRLAVKEYRDIPFSTLEKLIQNEYHEIRLLGLLILVDQYQHAKDQIKKEELFQLYLANTKYINNWDLVDLTADRVVGAHLENGSLELLEKLARSDSLWEKRIAILSTFHFIKKGDPEPCLQIVKILLSDPNDLIHKATGWMLREVGKRCNQDLEELFIQKHYQEMSRTTLRYAIEKFSAPKREYYLKYNPNTKL